MLGSSSLLIVLVLTTGNVATTSSDPSALYKEAGRLRKSGDLAGASRAYRQAHEALRASNFDHSNVLDSLLESVSLALQTQNVKPDVPLLCDARKLVTEYAAATAARGATAGPEVTELREQVDAALDRSKGSCQLDAKAPTVLPENPAPAGQTPPSDSPPAKNTKDEAQAEPEGPTPPPPLPAFARRRLSPTQIAGYSSIGVAGFGAVLMFVGIGTGIRYELIGQDHARMGSTAEDLQNNIIRLGESSNRMAIAGATIASIAAATAVALLVTSRPKTRNSARVRLAQSGVSF